MPKARGPSRDLHRCRAADDREDIDAGGEPVLLRVRDVLVSVMTQDEVPAIRRDAVIVVYSGSESGRNLYKALVTASRQVIELTLAVHHKEAPVGRPVRRLEVPIVAIDDFDASGVNLHRSE